MLPRIAPPRRGLTLLELVAVLVILVALAALVVPIVASLSTDARDTVTRSTLSALRETIVNRYWPDMNGVMSAGTVVADGLPQPHPDSAQRSPTSREFHPQLAFLFNPPVASLGQAQYRLFRRGWNGPYVQYTGAIYRDPAVMTEAQWVARGFSNAYGVTGDPTVLDGWGNPIVLQRPAGAPVRLVSAGPNGILETTEAMPEPASDDISVALVY
ncbi:MAG: prepilin-type N-terminal cleavage/methylation domain-containing protein [Gemmataceae bacterium]|nr:prepilin-type N-terminal cleavage/methylation domain-containing protein [Gemmataceae bacterium]MDW8267265.1 prepilin-type N-terminal cleavage/methylation domain-containing protein [Gemmataceae bacterium]